MIIRVEVTRSLFIHQSPGGYFRRIANPKRQMKPEIYFRKLSGAVALHPFETQTGIVISLINILFKDTVARLLRQNHRSYRF